MNSGMNFFLFYVFKASNHMATTIQMGCDISPNPWWCSLPPLRIFHVLWICMHRGGPQVYFLFATTLFHWYYSNCDWILFFFPQVMTSLVAWLKVKHLRLVSIFYLFIYLFLSVTWTNNLKVSILYSDSISWELPSTISSSSKSNCL